VSRRSQMIYFVFAVSVLAQSVQNGALLNLSGEAAKVEFGGSLSLIHNSTEDELVCSGKIRASDVIIEGMNISVAEMMTEFVTMKEQVAKMFHTLTELTNSPISDETISPPPALPPTPLQPEIVTQYTVTYAGHTYRTLMSDVPVQGAGQRCHGQTWRVLPAGWEVAPDTDDVRNDVVIPYTWNTHVMILYNEAGLDSYYPGYTTRAGRSPAGGRFGDSQAKAQIRVDGGQTEMYAPWNCYQVLIRQAARRQLAAPILMDEDESIELPSVSAYDVDKTSSDAPSSDVNDSI